jgi:Glycosyltransferase
MREKGIEEAIDAIQEINERAGRMMCSLDIYGLIDLEYEEGFKEKLKNASTAIQYRGIVPYDKSVETIKQYYCLLFPTRWKGEGFPGTVIDAFSAGLPVIATDWNSNKEIINNLKNGIIYPNQEFSTLVDCIIWMIGHLEEHYKMSLECIKSAKGYQPDLYIAKIKEEIGL